MDKYTINYIYNENNDINDIFVSVLKKELKKYIQVICKNKKCEVPSSYQQFSLDGGKHC